MNGNDIMRWLHNLFNFFTPFFSTIKNNLINIFRHKAVSVFWIKS